MGSARGPMAEWLRRGLQILARRFDSGSGLHFLLLFPNDRAPEQAVRPAASLQLPRNGQKNGPAASGRAWKVWERMPERPARNGPAEVLHQMQKLHRLLRLTQQSS